MRSIRNKFLFAGALAALSVSALAQMTPGPRDPYTQGSATSGGSYDPYTSGARSGDKFDPYSQGADQSTHQNLAPQSQPAPNYQLTPPPSPQRDVVGTSSNRSEMRWSGPLLGKPLGPRNRYLDGA